MVAPQYLVGVEFLYGILVKICSWPVGHIVFLKNENAQEGEKRCAGDSLSSNC